MRLPFFHGKKLFPKECRLPPSSRPGVASSRFFPQKNVQLAHNNFLFSLLDFLAGSDSDDESPPALLLFSFSSFSLGNCLSNVPLRLGIGGGAGKDWRHQVSSLNTHFFCKGGQILALLQHERLLQTRINFPPASEKVVKYSSTNVLKPPPPPLFSLHLLTVVISLLLLLLWADAAAQHTTHSAGIMEEGRKAKKDRWSHFFSRSSGGLTGEGGDTHFPLPSVPKMPRGGGGILGAKKLSL